jgi:predicted membrane metal-binding protein
MIAAILDTSTLGKVILYALLSGVGVSVVFALGVSSAAGLVDAVRQRRSLVGALWGMTAVLCLLASLGAIVLGIVVMSSKR